MLTEEKRNRISEKWKQFRESGSGKRKKMLEHTFAFYVKYNMGEEDAFHFHLDGVEVVVGLGYAGPRMDGFVRIVTSMKERDLLEVGYLYEPGASDLLFSRRKENIYIELPYMEDGFFLRYSYFIERIMEGYRRPVPVE